MDNLVSIIIPCYNLGAYLKESLNSVFQQSYPNKEIIVIDDGSTDHETIQVLQEIQGDPRVSVVHTQNNGLPAARNEGIKRAHGTYISCLDADDLFHPSFLEKAIAILKNDSTGKIGFVTSHVVIFEQSNSTWKTPSFDPIELILGNIAHVSSVFRRETWANVGGYSTQLSGYQDWNFWMSIVASGKTWHTIEESLFYYRDRKGSMIHTSNQNRPQLTRKIYDLNKKFIQEHAIDALLLYQNKMITLESSYTEAISYIRALESRVDTQSKTIEEITSKLIQAQADLEKKEQV